MEKTLGEWLTKYMCSLEDIQYSEEWGFYIIAESDELKVGAGRINVPKQFWYEAGASICSTCNGTGEVGTMDYVYPGEPHMADIGDNRPCPELPHTVVK